MKVEDHMKKNLILSNDGTRHV